MCSPLRSADSLALQLERINLGTTGEEQPPLMPGEEVGPGILLHCVVSKRPMTCEALEFYLTHGCLRDPTLYEHIYLFSPNQDSALMILLHHQVPVPRERAIQSLFQGGCTQQTLETLVQAGALVLSSQDYDATPVASDPMGWLDCLVKHEIPPLPRTLHLLLMNLAPGYVCSDYFRRVYTTFLPQTELDADLFNLVLWHYRDGDLLRDLVERQVPINLTTCLLIEHFGLFFLLNHLTTQINPILEHLSPGIGFIYDQDPAEPVEFDAESFNAVWLECQEFSADLLNLALLRGREENFITSLIERGVKQDSMSQLIMKAQNRI